MMDTSEIDRKIEEIRQKYQEYAGQSVNYRKYNIAEPESNSRSTIDRA